MDQMPNGQHKMNRRPRPSYPQTSHYRPTPPPRSAMAIASLVLGIVALATSLLPIINNLSFFIAILAIIFAIVAFLGIRKGAKSGTGLAVAGLATAIVAVIAVLVSQAAYSAAINQATEDLDNSMSRLTGDATEEILTNDVNLAFGEFTAVSGDYGLVTTSLPVRLTNISGETQSFNIQVEAVDVSGNRIATDYIVVSNLGPNRSQNFTLFSYVPSDDLEAMKSATFEVVSASAY